MAHTENITLREPLITVVSEALQALPEVCLKSMEREPSAPVSRPDFEIQLEVRGHPLRLLVEEKKAAAYPRDVFAMVRQAASFVVGSGEIPTLPMVIAQALPMSSREILRNENVAYGDSSGSLFLSFAGALFYIDKPVPRSPIRKALNIYKGKTTQVLHALLSTPKRSWHVNELALESGVVPSTVHQVFQVLEEQLWMERKGRGPEVVRVLRDPCALLNAWRDEHSLKQYDVRSYYGWSQTPLAFRNSLSAALEEAHAEYALTLSSGAELVAPFVTSVEKLSVLLPDTFSLRPIIERAKLEPVEDGANVHFYLSKNKTPFLKRRQIDETWVAGDIQLYLDLWASPARGKEQAEHLRKERLSY